MKFSHVPAWVFGRAKKCEIEKTDPLFNPEPGLFAPRKNGHGPTWHIGSALRGSKNLNNNYGPGQYNIPNKVFNGPKYSMVTKAGGLIQLKLPLHLDLVNIMLLQKIGQVVPNIQ